MKIARDKHKSREQEDKNEERRYKKQEGVKMEGQIVREKVRRKVSLG